MRILFVADGRSPTAIHWIRHWLESGHEVHLVSTYACDPIEGVTSLQVLPVATGRMNGSNVKSNSRSIRRSAILRLRGVFLFLRYFLGPISAAAYKMQFLGVVSEIQPDLVHALRIPFEGMLARYTPGNIPLIVSIWGNDLTLHASGSFLMRRSTRKTLERTDGLMADTNRDITLAQKWGFDTKKPALVIPGSGGLRLAGRMDPDLYLTDLPTRLPLGPILVNPRGQRPGSLRQDNFFQAIPLVLKEFPQAVFVCPALNGDPLAEKWVKELGITSSTWLWPKLPQNQLWTLLKNAQVFVSPSLHDGTPNSLLEAMACGCFPVVGDIESMREWIQPGVNGILVDAASPRSLAEGMKTALKNEPLRESAKRKNASLIAERAEYQHCMATAEAFYRTILTKESIPETNL